MAGKVCPWWIGYLLSSPIRRWFEDPEKILGEYVKPDLTVLDVGCAMGFFTLPLARLVGPEGRVIAVDLQEKMINSLKRRAARAGLLERIDLRFCGDKDLRISDLAGQIDLAVAFHVVHEVPDALGLMTQLFRVAKPGGRLFMAEPKGHVSAEEYEMTEATAQQAGFVVVERPQLKRSRATMFERS